MAYAPVFIGCIASPSHMLFSTDTLLLLGFVVRCLKAYAGSDNETLAKYEILIKIIIYLYFNIFIYLFL